MQCFYVDDKNDKVVNIYILIFLVKRKYSKCFVKNFRLMCINILKINRIIYLVEGGRLNGFILKRNVKLIIRVIYVLCYCWKMVFL